MARLYGGIPSYSPRIADDGNQFPVDLCDGRALRSPELVNARLSPAALAGTMTINVVGVECNRDVRTDDFWLRTLLVEQPVCPDLRCRPGEG